MKNESGWRRRRSSLPQRNRGAKRVPPHAAPVLVVAGEVTAKVEESKYHLTGFYRRWLSAREYARVQAAVRRLTAKQRWWQFFIYNCNSFVAEITTTLGMRSPFPLMEPHDFVSGLRRLNDD